MLRNIISGCALLFSLFFAATLQAETTTIHAGKLITATDKNVREQMTIIVKNNTITHVLPGFQTPLEDSTLIDLSDYTVMPGFMDMHTHLSYQHGGPSTYMKRVQYNE